MDAPQPKNNTADINIDGDYISNLPADIKEKILTELSLKEAVRTSILSSTWKDSWTSLPNLVFEEESTESRLIELVDKVLRVHQGPIQKFEFGSQHACNEAISRWMLILSTNLIEDLDLDFQGDECVIPSRFFSCHTLKSVCLSGCSINVPQFFNDFTLLHTLCLTDFNLSGFGIEKLVSSCPLLEYLELDNFVQQGCLRILAPKLTFLDIRGDFNDICLETPKLVEGIIYLYGNIGDYRMFIAAKDGKEINITRALGHLSNIQKLAIWGKFIDYLAMGPIPKNLPPMFNHLSKLSVGFSNGPNEIAPPLYLFKNAPNLKELQIRFLDFADPPYVEVSWESKAIHECLFKCLEVVNIMYSPVPGSLERAMSMLEFAKLVLSTAPLLEEFRITDLEEDIVVFEGLKLFPKLSKKCKLVLLKNFNEESNGDKENDDDDDEESDDDDEESDDGDDDDDDDDDDDEESDDDDEEESNDVNEEGDGDEESDDDDEEESNDNDEEGDGDEECDDDDESDDSDDENDDVDA